MVNLPDPAYGNQQCSVNQNINCLNETCENWEDRDLNLGPLGTCVNLLTCRVTGVLIKN